ncbi:DUF1937 family protein [Photobacterium sp. GJ3]|uniref:DUF1937 family protein n=1 Tax=Photobacterium sp. GJ3 TaxID=2829502 RepID=UPI001B8CE105|nr:DUF1937 family protein [Photobacterium sp. GJ3]
MTMYFLACPYGHEDRDTVMYRFDECTKAAAKIFQSGRAVYSQITMSHPVNEVIQENQLGENIVWPRLTRRSWKSVMNSLCWN